MAPGRENGEPKNAKLPFDKQQARRLLRYSLRRAAADLLPGFMGLCSCGQSPIIERHADDLATEYRQRAIEIRLHKSTGNVSYGGLMMCGSPWVCPVCSTKITEHRANELEAALSKHLASGGVAYLVTPTVPHLRKDALKSLLAGFGKARISTKGQRRYKSLMSRMGAIGDVSAVESPYSNNGWHPHAHLLIFATVPLDADTVADEIYSLWSKAVANRTDLGATSRAAFDVRLITNPEEAAGVSEYLSKSSSGKAETWGPGRELAKGPSKISRTNGASAFELLRIYHERDDEAARSLHLSNYRQAAVLFIEFAEATKGRKQLIWSRGLRAALGLGTEETDEELVQEAQTDTNVLGSLPPADFRLIVKLRLEGQLLEVARLEGWAGVVQVLQALRVSYGPQPPPN